MVDKARIEDVLAGLRVGYEADGYELLVEDVVADTVTIRIAAGPDACEECLVAKPIAIEIFKETLKDVPDVGAIEIIYPTD